MVLSTGLVSIFAPFQVARVSSSPCQNVFGSRQDNQNSRRRRPERTCFRFLLVKIPTKKKTTSVVNFDYQNANYLCLRHFFTVIETYFFTNQRTNFLWVFSNQDKWTPSWEQGNKQFTAKDNLIADCQHILTGLHYVHNSSQHNVQNTAQCDTLILPVLAIFRLMAIALLWAMRMGNRTLRSQLPGGNTTVSTRNSLMASRSSSRESAQYATSWKAWKKSTSFNINFQSISTEITHLTEPTLFTKVLVLVALVRIILSWREMA